MTQLTQKSTSAATPAISVVVPHYNRGDIVLRTLQALEEQRLDAPYEVIVVDDCSTDGSWDLIQEFAQSRGEWLQAIRLERNSNASAARNAGLARVRAPLVLFLDADIVTRPDVLAAHLEGHTLRPEENVVLLGVVRFPEDLPLTGLRRLMNPAGQWDDIAPGAELPWWNVFSGHVSMKTSFVRAVGGFDEDLAIFHDIELGKRLHNQGMRLYLADKAVGSHYHDRTLPQIVRFSEAYGRYFAELGSRDDPELYEHVRESWYCETGPRVVAKTMLGAAVGNALVRPLTVPLASFLLDRIPAIGNPLTRLILFHVGHRAFLRNYRPRGGAA